MLNMLQIKHQNNLVDNTECNPMMLKMGDLQDIHTSFGFDHKYNFLGKTYMNEL